VSLNLQFESGDSSADRRTQCHGTKSVQEAVNVRWISNAGSFLRVVSMETLQSPSHLVGLLTGDLSRGSISVRISVRW
jgi:hypothetical protein